MPTCAFTVVVTLAQVRLPQTNAANLRLLQSNHAIIIYNHNPSMMKQKLNYRHQNPVQEGIVELAEEYLFSSARDYAGKKGIVKTTLI
jgi:hypothetical protein